MIRSYPDLPHLSGASRFVGRFNPGPGDAQDLSGDSATRMLSVFTSSAQGVVPGSGGGTVNFLRADGTWSPPPGSGSVSLTRITGMSGTAGADLTWQFLTANTTTTAVTPGAVMFTNGVGAGLWTFKYTIRFGSSATTTGLRITLTHSGTTTHLATHWRYVDTSATAATGVANHITTAATGGVVGGFAMLGFSTSVASVGVVTANANNMAFLEGIIGVTAAGTLELRVSSEVAGSSITIYPFTCLELNKIAS